MGPRAGREDLTDVHALMYLERPSQKAIVIGAKGTRLKEVGTAARHRIEALLGTRVYLDLHIKIAKDWQRDPKQLRRLGFYDEPAGTGGSVIDPARAGPGYAPVHPSPEPV